MSICIKTQNGDVLWFDAVTSFDEMYNSTVSNHPLETGTQVTDHVVRENTKLKISGVFSDYDPNTNRSQFSFILNNTEQVSSSRIVNNNPQTEVLITQRGLGEVSPTGFDYSITETSTAIDTTEFIKRVLKDAQTSGNPVTILDFEGSVIRANGYYPNCVITGLAFAETSDSGQALYADIDLEIVRFVDLRKVNLPKALTQKGRAKNAKPSASNQEKVNNAPTKDEAKSKESSQLNRAIFGD